MITLLSAVSFPSSLSLSSLRLSPVCVLLLLPPPPPSARGSPLAISVPTLRSVQFRRNQGENGNLTGLCYLYYLYILMCPLCRHARTHARTHTRNLHTRSNTDTHTRTQSQLHHTNHKMFYKCLHTSLCGFERAVGNAEGNGCIEKQEVLPHPSSLSSDLPNGSPRRPGLRTGRERTSRRNRSEERAGSDWLRGCCRCVCVCV